MSSVKLTASSASERGTCRHRKTAAQQHLALEVRHGHEHIGHAADLESTSPIKLGNSVQRSVDYLIRDRNLASQDSRLGGFTARAVTFGKLAGESRESASGCRGQGSLWPTDSRSWCCQTQNVHSAHLEDLNYSEIASVSSADCTLWNQCGICTFDYPCTEPAELSP